MLERMIKNFLQNKGLKDTMTLKSTNKSQIEKWEKKLDEGIINDLCIYTKMRREYAPTYKVNYCNTYEVTYYLDLRFDKI